MDLRVVEELHVFPDAPSDVIIPSFDCAADIKLRPFLSSIESALLKIFRHFEKSQVFILLCKIMLNLLTYCNNHFPQQNFGGVPPIPLYLLRNSLVSLPFFIPLDIKETRDINLVDIELFTPSDLIALFSRFVIFIII
jgi:hypothetical protein